MLRKRRRVLQFEDSRGLQDDQDEDDHQQAGYDPNHPVHRFHADMDVIVPGFLLVLDCLGEIAKLLLPFLQFLFPLFQRFFPLFELFLFRIIPDYFLAMYLRISRETASTITRPCTT